MGCQPRDHYKAVKTLLDMGADRDLLSNRGDTFIMELAGAGHWLMLKFLYLSIARGWTPPDLGHENCDGRNLYSIVGLAVRNRKNVNPHARKIVEDFVRMYCIPAEGLATHSSANRGRKKRRQEEWLHHYPVYDASTGRVWSCGGRQGGSHYQDRDKNRSVRRRRW